MAAAQRISAEIISLPEKKILTALAADMGTTLSAAVTNLLSTGGLRIKGAASALANTATAFYALALTSAGVPTLVTKAANTDMAALSGTVANATFNVFCYFIDSAGVLTTSMGTAGATLAAVVFPTFPAGKACIGFTIINPTGTGGFVGGTTALDDATVVPNAVYINTVGPFNPTAAQTVIA